LLGLSIVIVAEALCLFVCVLVLEDIHTYWVFST